MRATEMARLAGIGEGRARHRRGRAGADRARLERRAAKARAMPRETAVFVEVAGYDALMARDPSTARRVRARARRVVRGAALRYGGDVLYEAGGRVECVFPTELDAALAASHARAGLAGDRGVGATVVVHGRDSGGRTAEAVARDVARPGEVLLLDDLALRLSPFAELHVRRLGTYMVAGVPRPLHLAALEATDNDGAEVQAWSAPWMARLARRGAWPPRTTGAGGRQK